MTAATDLKFTSTGEGGLKFRLQPDSPAIDRGAVIPGVTDGHTGTAPDLGAYEYGGTDWVAGCNLRERTSPAGASNKRERKGRSRNLPNQQNDFLTEWPR